VIVIYRLDTSEAMGLFVGPQPMKPQEWRAFCEERGVLAFAAEEGGDLVGLALAESGPRAVHVVALDGRHDACWALLERFVRLSGERDVTAWCQEGRDDLRRMLEGRGFSRLHAGKAMGRPARFFRLARNDMA
jgi:hypothetical protein